MEETFKIGGLKKLFDKLLSLILPKNRDVEEIENMSEIEITSLIPVASEMGDEKFKAVFEYKNKVTRRAIWEIKYSANKIITEKFSKLLYEFIIENMSDEAAFSNFTKPIMIPIPADKKSYRNKGFNQCDLIVKDILKLDNNQNFEICFDTLKKIKETEHQSKIKNRARRLKNLEGSFQALPQKVVGRNIILIDDVITTGATMREASRSLKEAGAKKIIGFAIAH